MRFIAWAWSAKLRPIENIRKTTPNSREMRRPGRILHQIERMRADRRADQQVTQQGRHVRRRKAITASTDAPSRSRRAAEWSSAFRWSGTWAAAFESGMESGGQG